VGGVNDNWRQLWCRSTNAI